MDVGPMRTLLLAILFSPAALHLFGQQESLVTADTVFYNGKVVTVDPAFNIHEAFAVKGDRFLAVGSNTRIRALAGPKTNLVDLGGRAVIPGLTDSHIHPWRYVFSLLKGVDLTGVKSLVEISTRIREAAAAAPPGQVIYAAGRWSETELSEKRAPTRLELDQLAPDRPVMIIQGRQKAVLNSAALKAAGISRDTKLVYGEPLPKQPDGEPTGVITNGWSIMSAGARLIPVPEIRELWLKVQQELNAQGFTSIREPMVPIEIMRLYGTLRQEGKLTLRVSMGLDVGPGQANELDAILGPLGTHPGFGDQWLRLDSVGEFAVDGNTSTNPTPEMFRTGVLTMNRYGWRPAPHVNGEKPLDIVLDSYEAADQEKSIRGRRWVLEHATMLRPDQIERFARLGVLISAQFQPYNGSENMIRTWGRERADRILPMREMLNSGLNVSSGSDWSGGAPNNPFIPFYFYVTRKAANGTVMGAAQKITRQEALRVVTINNAYLTFEEKIKGSIEADKVADFVILSDDVLTVPEEQIRSIHPLATYVAGQKVFSSMTQGF